MRINPALIKPVHEFTRAATRLSSVDPRRNIYVVFGVAWGTALNVLVGGGASPATSASVSTASVLPSDGYSLLAPLLLGWVFGTLGTIRTDKVAALSRTARLLQIEVHNQTEAVRAAYLESVFALAATLEAKSAYTHGHCRRVWGYAERIGRVMGLGPRQLEQLEHACYLHDVGKIGVPDAVLNKPGRLTDDEYAAIRAHSAVGADIVGRVSTFTEVAGLVRWHHERMDGSGYPDGLEGSEIPLAARILAVADTMDAMCSSRPYREGLPVPAALAELRRCAGLEHDPSLLPGRDRELRQHFDPRVVEALCKVVEHPPETAPLASPEEPMARLGLRLPTPLRQLNCWEIKGCGAERLSANHPLGCPVVHASALDGVNGGTAGGRACWMVSGARCRRTLSRGAARGQCVECEVIERVRLEEGPVWFQVHSEKASDLVPPE